MSADVAANGATVVLLVNEPVFNALRAKGVIAGTCNAPNGLAAAQSVHA